MRSVLPPRLVRVTLVSAAAAVVGGCNTVPGPELSIGGGLGAMDLRDEGGFTNVLDGPRAAGLIQVGVDTSITDVDDRGSGPRLGGKVGIGYAQRNLGSRAVAGESLLRIEDFVGLTLIAPQATASYRQYLTGNAYDANGLYLEPGVGAGLTFGVLNFGSRLEFGDTAIGQDRGSSESSVSYAVQPFLRGGYDMGGTTIGLEGGYLFTGVDFDDSLGRDAGLGYVGIFVGIRLGR